MVEFEYDKSTCCVCLFIHIQCYLKLEVSTLIKLVYVSQKVDYPLELDVYDLCSDDLRKKLEAPRKVFCSHLASLDFKITSPTQNFD